MSHIKKAIPQIRSKMCTWCNGPKRVKSLHQTVTGSECSQYLNMAALTDGT